jgi:alcohol dehydrogenase, propanol-preferring
MRAMLLEQPHPAEKKPLSVREVSAPTPSAREVRLRVHCCAVCHTDLHIVEGEVEAPRYPIIPGHQIVGTVDAVGSDVKTLREGDRVGMPWLHWTCGECRFCLAGQENLCERAQFTGLHRDGGYADHALADAAFVCALPNGFDDAQAAPLLCAGIIGYRSLRLSGAQTGATLGLYGFGASAHITLQIARKIGCEVLVFTRGEGHRELARKLGASRAGDAKDAMAASLDAAIIFAPAGALVQDALRALRKGGTCALAGITMSDIPQMPYELLYGERILRSVANATRNDAREFLQLAAEVPVATTVREFSLEQANEALVAVKHSAIEGAAVLRVAG